MNLLPRWINRGLINPRAASNMFRVYKLFDNPPFLETVEGGPEGMRVTFANSLDRCTDELLTCAVEGYDGRVLSQRLNYLYPHNTGYMDVEGLLQTLNRVTKTSPKSVDRFLRNLDSTISSYLLMNYSTLLNTEFNREFRLILYRHFLEMHTYASRIVELQVNLTHFMREPLNSYERILIIDKIENILSKGLPPSMTYDSAIAPFIEELSTPGMSLEVLFIRLKHIHLYWAGPVYMEAEPMQFNNTSFFYQSLTPYKSIVDIDRDVIVRAQQEAMLPDLYPGFDFDRVAQLLSNEGICSAFVKERLFKRSSKSMLHAIMEMAKEHGVVDTLALEFGWEAPFNMTLFNLVAQAQGKVDIGVPLIEQLKSTSPNQIASISSGTEVILLPKEAQEIYLGQRRLCKILQIKCSTDLPSRVDAEVKRLIPVSRRNPSTSLESRAGVETVEWNLDYHRTASLGFGIAIWVGCLAYDALPHIRKRLRG